MCQLFCQNSYVKPLQINLLVLAFVFESDLKNVKSRPNWGVFLLIGSCSVPPSALYKIRKAVLYCARIFCVLFSSKAVRSFFPSQMVHWLRQEHLCRSWYWHSYCAGVTHRNTGRDALRLIIIARESTFFAWHIWTCHIQIAVFWAVSLYRDIRIMRSKDNLINNQKSK